MKNRNRGVLALLGAALAIALIGWLALRADDPAGFAGGTRVELAAWRDAAPTGAPARLATADPVVRGEYLARAGDCVACHTAPGGKPFAGGLAFKLPFGTLYSSNITPDRERGIGGWSDEQFVKAMHEGIGPRGKFLYSAFPYTAYTLLARDDVLAIKAYLFSLAPVANQPPANDLWFPFNQRPVMWFWNLLYNRDERFRPNTQRSAEWNRGAYLVEALGHCGECHTPRTLLQGLSGRKFAGTMLGGWKAYNISSDPQSGVGAWSAEQLAAYLSSGHAEGRSTAAGPMGEVVEHSLRFLAEEDIRGMVTYLRSVPPIGNVGAAAVAQTPPEGRGPDAAASDLGQRVFEGACAGCHHADGSGVQSAYAALLGNRTASDPGAANLTQVVLHGARLPTRHGEVFMPGFGDAYSDAEIAAVVNHVTARFGASTSNITAEQIARRRAQE